MSSRRSEKQHVVFYVPGIGALLSAGSRRPAGGAETQMLAVAKALAAQGHRVAIVAYGDGSDLPEEVDGVRVIARPQYRKRGFLEGKLAETFHIWRALWSCPAHVIVTRCAGVQVGLVALYARAARQRMVFSSAADVDFDSVRILPQRHDRWLYHLGVRLAHDVVVQTEAQELLCEQTFNRRPALIKSIASLMPEQHSKPEAFLWVGRVVPYKRPLRYVELARAVPEARFWMIGVPGASSPSTDQLLAQLADQAAGTPNLELLEPRPHAEVGKLLDRTVAAVNTSDFEGMPNALLEGWSRGVPALALSHDPGGVIVDHGLGDFAGGSFTALVASTRTLWAQRHDRAGLAARCRAYVAQEHSPSKVARGWGKVLRLPAVGTSTDR